MEKLKSLFTRGSSEPMITADQFHWYVETDVENVLVDHYIDDTYEAFKFYTKGKCDKVDKQKFSERLQQILQKIQAFYINEKYDPKILSESQYLYKFVQKVDQKLTADIESFYLNKYNSPIIKKLTNIEALFKDKQPDQEFKFTPLNDRYLIIDPKFDNWDKYSDIKEFQVCKVYNDIYYICKSMEEQLPLILSEEFFKKNYATFTQSIYNSTLSILKLLEDPVTACCVYSQVFKLSQLKDSTKLSTQFHVLLTLFYPRVIELFDACKFVGPETNPNAKTVEDELILKITPLVTITTLLIENFPKIPQNQLETFQKYNLRFTAKFTELCNIVSDFTDEEYVSIITQLYNIIKIDSLYDFTRQLIKIRNQTFMKEYFNKYIPGLCQLATPEPLDLELLKQYAPLEVKLMLKPVIRSLIIISRGIFTTEQINEKLINHSVTIMKELICDSLKKLIKAYPDIASEIGDFEFYF